MPSPDRTERTLRRKDVEPVPQRVVVYAGTSPKRLSFLNYAFPSPDFIVEPVSGGDELDISNVVKIASGKVEFAMHRDDVRERLLRGHGNVVVASDIRTSPYIRLSTDPSGKTLSMGKPYDEYQVMKTFRRIARAAVGQNPTSEKIKEAAEKTPPFYNVASGTAIQTRYSRNMNENPTTVVLDLEKVIYFGTKKGFGEYLAAFNTYYSSDIYRNDGKHPKPNLTDIAAGLSLVPLLITGAVLEIDGAERNSPDFRRAVKMALYKVNVGFSPELLRILREDVGTVINNWPWLERTTAVALGELPLQS